MTYPHSTWIIKFMTKVALPGSVHEIDLSADVLTHPTVGPLFGSYKVQYDVFQIPVRLYQGKLHMNMINIGRDMSKVILPQVKLKGENPPVNADDYGHRDYDNWQINPSSIFKYLGISGLGIKNNHEEIEREFQAATSIVTGKQIGRAHV